MTWITLIESATIFNLEKLFICQNMHSNREYFSLFFQTILDTLCHCNCNQFCYEKQLYDRMHRRAICKCIEKQSLWMRVAPHRFDISRSICMGTNTTHFDKNVKRLLYIFHHHLEIYVIPILANLITKIFVIGFVSKL